MVYSGLTLNHCEAGSKMADHPENLDAVLDRVSGFWSDEDIARLKDAYQFAEAAHSDGPPRKTGHPFISHPLAVAEILTEIEADPATVIAGLLHDVVEDTDVSIEQIEERFGDSVAQLVDGVTTLSRLSFQTRQERQAGNLRKMFLAMAEDIRALIPLGIDVEIKTVEAGAWSQNLRDGAYHMTMMPYTLMTGEPDFFMREWVWSQGALNVARSYGYADAHADELTLEAVSEMDPQQRKAMYDELQEIVARDVPFTPLYHEITIYAMRSDVHDLELDIQFKPSIERAYRGD